MKGKRVIAGILLVGILATALAGCKNADVTKKEREKPVITLGSDSYPPYNYLNEDGILCTLAYCAARIIPSVPLFPKPPGTRIPSTL